MTVAIDDADKKIYKKYYPLITLLKVEKRDHHDDPSALFGDNDD